MAPDHARRFPTSPVLHFFQQDGGWHWGITAPCASGCGFKLIAFSDQIFPIEILDAVNGAMYVSGVQAAVVTSVDFTVNGNFTSGDVVGSNIAPDIFPSSIDVTGTRSAYFEDETFQSSFFNETEVVVLTVLTASSLAGAPWQAYNFPRRKFDGAMKNDGVAGLVQSVPFVALPNKNPLPGALVKAMSIQDAVAI
jgi:Phage tail tube protein